MKPIKFEFGSKELHLTLTSSQVMEIEAAVKKSLLNVFIDGEGNQRMPMLAEALLILHGANTVANVKQSDMVKLYDEYLDAGHDFSELMLTLFTLVDEAGLFGKRKNVTPEIETDLTALIPEV